MMFWEVALSTETLGHNSVDPRSNGLFGVYVHWPFCAAKCPIATSTRMSIAASSTKRPMSRPMRRELAYFAPPDARPHGAVDLLRRRHPLADGSAFGRRHPRCHRRPLGDRSARRDHARGQPDLGRGRPFPRLSRCRRQPRLAGRSSRCARARWPSSAAATTVDEAVSRGAAGAIRSSRARASISSTPARARRSRTGRTS